MAGFPVRLNGSVYGTRPGAWCQPARRRSRPRRSLVDRQTVRNVGCDNVGLLEPALHLPVQPVRMKIMIQLLGRAPAARSKLCDSDHGQCFSRWRPNWANDKPRSRSARHSASKSSGVWTPRRQLRKPARLLARRARVATTVLPVTYATRSSSLQVALALRRSVNSAEADSRWRVARVRACHHLEHLVDDRSRQRRDMECCQTSSAESCGTSPGSRADHRCMRQDACGSTASVPTAIARPAAKPPPRHTARASASARCTSIAVRPNSGASVMPF